MHGKSEIGGEKDDQSSFRADYWQSKPEAVTALVELRDRYLETYNSKTDIWENQLEPFLNDAIFQENKSQIRNFQSATNFSIIKTPVINSVKITHFSRLNFAK